MNTFNCLWKRSHWLLAGFFGMLMTGQLTAQTVKTSWLGNTFPGGNDKWVQNHVNSFYVAPDGTCYTQSIWDEGHTENAFYKDGDKIGRLENMGGGLAVGGDGTYVFASEGNETSDAIQRFNPDGSKSNFATGDNRITLPPGTKSYDLAAGNGELYVSDPNNGRILVFNAETGNSLRSFAFVRPANMAVEPNGNLWIVQSAYDYGGRIRNKPFIAPAKILHYSKTGEKLPQEITDVVEPGGVAVDKRMNRLLVAEYGPGQQVRAYTHLATTPTLDASFGNSGTFGEKFGTLSGERGKTGSFRFYNLAGVGVDSTGNLYVSLGGPVPKEDNPMIDTDIRKFNAALTEQVWQLLGKEFVDIGDADPQNPTHYYTKDSKYVLDYAETTPGTGWKFDAWTIDRFSYPQDPRAQANGGTGLNEAVENIYMRRIGGKLFMYGNSMAGDQGPMRIWRFDSTTDGEIAIPCARIGSDNSAYPPNHPEGEFIWRDLNKNGKYETEEYAVNTVASEYDYKTAFWPDSQGNLWRAYRERGIRKLTCQGLDENGIPKYSFDPREYWEMPEPFSDVHKMRYDPETDVMYLSGFTKSNPNTSGGDEPSGVKSIVRYNNWSKENRTLVWENDKGDRYDLNRAAGFEVAGDYVFTVALIGQRVNVFKGSTGERVSSFLPDPAVVGSVDKLGWVDIWDAGIRVRKLASGVYTIFVEEDYRSKTIIYQWTPPAEHQLVLTSPSDGATFISGVNDTVVVSAFIADAAGSIAHVDFYNGDTILGSDSTAPYRYEWNQVPMGSYAVRAIAYDKLGVAVDTSAVSHFNVALLPDLAMTNISTDPPVAREGEPLTFKVTIKNVGTGAMPAGVTIGGVWKVNGNFVNYTDTYSQSLAAGDSVVLTANGGGNGINPAQWLPGKAGSYTVGFQVDDVSRIEETNEKNNYFEQTLCVGKLKGAPSITLTSPADGGLIEAGDSTTFRVNASDCDGFVTKVAYYSGGIQLGKSETIPFDFTWKNAPLGSYTIQAIATDNAGLTDTSAVVHFTVAGPREPENPVSTATGVRYWYYKLPASNGFLPDFSTLTPADSGVVNGFDVSLRTQEENFAFRYEGYIDVPTDGSYTFYTISDDGSKLYLGNDLIVNNDGPHGMDERSGKRNLTAGKHAIRVDFVQGGGGYGLEVWYEGPGIEKQKIPSSVLYHLTPDSVVHNVVLSLSSATGTTNDEVSIPVRVKHFKDLVSAQGTLSWNARVATFIAVKDFGLPGMSAANFGKKAVKNGTLVFSWFDASLTPQSLADSAVLFSIRLKLTGQPGDSTALAFANGPVKLELVSSDGKTVDAQTSPGSLHIFASMAIAGKIQTPTGLPVKDVKVTLTGGNQAQQSTTAPEGIFSFTAAVGKTYVLTPVKRSDSLASNGLSTLDLILIQRHILGIQALPTPYAIIAADVNGSGTVTTQDLVAIQSVILQNTTRFPGNRLWTFLPSDYTFTDPANPFPYDSTRTIAASDTASQDFLGIKLGDVNGTWNNAGGRIATEYVQLDLNNLAAPAGSEVEIPVTVNRFQGLSGYQFTFSWDPKVLQFAGVNDPNRQAAYNVDQRNTGKLSTVWFDPSGGSLSLPDGETLMKMKFKVVGTAHSQSLLSITSSLTESVAYNDGLAEMKIISAPKQFRVGNAGELGTFGYELFQNQPNPFSESTAIGFALPQEERVAITVYNTMGQVVRNFTGTYPAGSHRLSWNGDSDGGGKVAPGTYFYRMQSGKFIQVRKMIVF